MTPFHRSAFPAALLLLLAAVGVLRAASPGQEELRGTVTDPEGRGLVGVRVALVVDGRPSASTFSDPEGAFRIRRPAGPGPISIVAERLGYAPLSRPLAAEELSGAPIRLQLVPAPLPLPAIEVEGVVEPCPARSDPDAWALWEAMARIHPDDLDRAGAATYTLARTDTLAGAAARTPFLSTNASGETGTEELVAGQRGFSGRLRLSWERRVDREGYAFLVRRTDFDGSYDAWSYAPLEADFASHFATLPFATHHRFREPTARSGGGWILAFCAPDPRRPALDGALELTADTVLIRAEWRFRTPEPDEAAGGWARFVEPPAGAPPPRLLPLESVTWRSLRDGRTQRRAQWYEDWIVTPGDSVPFLPDRTVDPGGPLR